MAILCVEGKNWKQYLVITDGRVAVVHMTPAVFGWNIGRVDVQSGADWPGMDAAAIVAWKATSQPEAIAVPLESLGDFGPKLLAAAGVES